MVAQSERMISAALVGLGTRVFDWSLSKDVPSEMRSQLLQLLLEHVGPVSHVDPGLRGLAQGLAAVHWAVGSTSHKAPPTAAAAAAPTHTVSPTAPAAAAAPDTEERRDAGDSLGATQDQVVTPSSPAQQDSSKPKLKEVVPPNPCGPPCPPPPASRAGAPAPELATANAQAKLKGAKTLQTGLKSGEVSRLLDGKEAGPSARRTSEARLLSAGFKVDETGAQAASATAVPRKAEAAALAPATAAGAEAAFVRVAFSASDNAKKLNGVFSRLPEALVNGRSVYAGPNGLHIMWLQDGNWVVTDQEAPRTGGEDDDVFAYVEDSASEPHLVGSSWMVLDDGEDFIADSRAGVVACAPAPSGGGKGGVVKGAAEGTALDKGASGKAAREQASGTAPSEVWSAASSGRADVVSVAFHASKGAGHLSGFYEQMEGQVANHRPVFLSAAGLFLVHTSDGTWAVTDTLKLSEGEQEEDTVFAYCEDAALAPWDATATWNVVADDAEFIEDPQAEVVRREE